MGIISSIYVPLSLEQSVRHWLQKQCIYFVRYGGSFNVMVLGKGWEGACSRCERFFIWMQPGGRARWHWNLLCPEYSSCVLTLLSPKCRLKAGSGALLTLEMEKVSEETSEDHWKPVDTDKEWCRQRETHCIWLNSPSSSYFLQVERVQLRPCLPQKSSSWWRPVNTFSSWNEQFSKCHL